MDHVRAFSDVYWSLKQMYAHVRSCILCRDDPDSCCVLSGDHNSYEIRGRLQLLCAAVLLYCILAIQQTQLPVDAVPLGSQLEFTSGTTITVMEDCVIKHGDVEKQPHLVDQLVELQVMYKAIEASTSYGVKKVYMFAPNIQSLCRLLVSSLGLVISWSGLHHCHSCNRPSDAYFLP